MGETEDVFRAATDHGDLRFYLFNKGDAAGAVAPVMRNEDHIALQIDPGMNQTILDALRDIRRQQKTPLAEGEFQDERTVVGFIKDEGGGLCDRRRTDGGGFLCRIVAIRPNGRGIRHFLLDGISLRIQKMDLDPGNIHRRRPVRQDPQNNTLFPDDPTEGKVKLRIRRLAVDPYLPHMKVLQDEQKPLQVVRMGMGQDHRIDPGDPFMPEVGGQHKFPEIEAVVEEAAAVHEHLFPAGETGSECCFPDRHPRRSGKAVLVESP